MLQENQVKMWKHRPKMVYEDLAPQFYDAFCFANHCNPQHPCRNWHVDKAIKRN